MNERAPFFGEVREFREMRFIDRGYGPDDYLPLGPCDVDELLETVTVKRVWDGEKWQRTR